MANRFPSYLSFSGFRSRIRRHQHAWILGTVLFVSLLAQAVNLFGYPAYREDEGTYMSQAWSVTNLHSLAPYTYWYDHAPAGWLFISAWNLIADVVSHPEMVVNNGRVFMSVIALASVALMYGIVWQLTKRKGAAACAALFFALMPLSIIFHRHVLLDNIMVCWLLVSLYTLSRSFRLTNILISAATFALAVLTKESAIVLWPAMVVLIFWHAHKEHRHFALVLWCSVSILCISLYPVFALLKGELFPTGTWLGGSTPHVSLFEALQFQSTREGGLFLEPGSSFRIALTESWLHYGAPLLFLGVVASLFHLIWRWRTWSAAIALMSLSYLLYLIRGQVLDWYVIPLIPLLSVSIALFLLDMVRMIYEMTDAHRLVRQTMTAIVTISLVFGLVMNSHVFTLKQTDNQVQAVAWVEDNIPRSSVMLIDNYAFVDLNKDMKSITDTSFHYYWKVDTDPQIKNDVLNNDWDNIDYLLTTPALRKSIYDDNLTLVKEAYEKSHVVKRFNNYDVWPEGYPVEIREVNNSNGTLHKSWQWYKDYFIMADGRVIDRSSSDQTTSEGQSYALLRAVWEDDQSTFDHVLAWTNTHLKRDDSHLFAWLARANADGSVHIIDQTTATDADEDIALALLFASKRWQNDAYKTQALSILADIWAKEIVSIKGTYYVMAGSGLERGDSYLINPSYFSPASYRIFAQADSTRPWAVVADDTYRILNKLDDSTIFNNEKTALVPNWFIVNTSGEYSLTTDYLHAGADQYGYDAFRLYWRIALDHLWFETSVSQKYLEKVTPFFKKEWEQNKFIYSVYQLDGTPEAYYGDVSTDAGALSVFFVTEPELAIDLYSDNFWSKFQSGYWGNKDKYYDQNWAWFATALYTHNTLNLWGDASALAKQ